MRKIATLAAALALTAAPVWAQSCIPYGNDGISSIPGQVIVTYSAEWSNFDHFNSSGNRLTTAGQVLQQDRANVHKFGKSTVSDSYDGFFTTVERRSLLSRATVTSYCHLNPAAARNALVNSSPVGTVVFYRAFNGSYVAVVDFAG